MNFKTDIQLLDLIIRKPLDMLRTTWICESTLSTINLKKGKYRPNTQNYVFKLKCFINYHI